MNKYALGTVVGTSLLGLAKSKTGSNLRLTKKTMKELTIVNEFFSIHYEDGDDQIDLIYEEIEQYISVDPLVYPIEEGEQYPFVDVFIDEIAELVNDEEEDFLIYRMSGEIKYTCLVDDKDPLSESQRVFSNIQNIINRIRPGYKEEQIKVHERYVQITINADTGEIYQNPKTRSKLRKR